ncbi:ATP-binding protein [Hymenobacter busanensis]|uniref:histidine kinase n=1 Tax=Hymenobacter busanensis TaxID=2607656 RepID=A0A7L4ZU87_9BACT|nr:ATP-binding protein [Hymenobacter busanensis]KAA9339219.1 ATP-binding protein [Hymenobacter busanensis]QHJ07019.1 ATP-binding protein [Hymenobacter busanensis]
MTSKRLELGIGLRLLGLLALLCAGFYAFQHQVYGLVAGAGLLLILAVWELARYVTRNNRALADYLLAVRYRDFAQHYNEQHADRSLRPLYAAFNQLNGTFRQLSAEREAQFTYLQTVLQLIDTGIISYDAVGQVEWLNESFKQTLELPYLKNIQALQKRLPVLYEAIVHLQPGTPTVVKLAVGAKTMQLLLSATAFRLHERQFTLVAFKNISHTLDETETAAWHKLLRVMTHELMNSVAPIASLADSLRRNLHREMELVPPNPSADHGLLDDVAEGLGIIQNRSEGLLRFAQVYRDLSTISSPQLATVCVQDVFGRVQGLMLPQLDGAGIALLTAVEPSELPLRADPHLLEQVLINLVLNAAYAVRETSTPRIHLRARAAASSRVLIEVADNGTGIPADLLDSIFIPFFTTRPNGSGIGLSLAKQIVHLHGGSIKVQSAEGEGTVFQLEL